jgi:hypothetical protein
MTRVLLTHDRRCGRSAASREYLIDIGIGPDRIPGEGAAFLMSGFRRAAVRAGLRPIAGAAASDERQREQ